MIYPWVVLVRDFTRLTTRVVNKTRDDERSKNSNQSIPLRPRGGANIVSRNWKRVFAEKEKFPSGKREGWDTNGASLPSQIHPPDDVAVVECLGISKVCLKVLGG